MESLKRSYPGRYDQSNPKASNETENGWQVNRRIEFKIK